jgi:putative thioredoxin
MSSDPTDIRMPGAVPLDPRPVATAPAADGRPGGGYVVDVTEATFQTEVIDRSQTVPVVIDFWAEWCGPCKQLSPVLERLVAEGGGSWVLAKIDVDANPRLGQAFGVQGIPSVKAVVGGQLVDLFTGAMPEAQIRPVLDQLRTIAAQLGVVGRAEPMGSDRPATEMSDTAADPASAIPPFVLEAEDALDRGDLAGAVAIFEKALADNPADEHAQRGLAQMRFIERVQRLGDETRVRRSAADRPDDVEAQLAVADLDVYGGHPDVAFDRLVDVVRRTAGDDRELVRKRLLDLFEIVGPDDPSVARGRRALTSALF